MSEIPNKYDLFITGNGFDVACGYKTRYVDFLKSNSHNESKLFFCFNKSSDLKAIEDENWNSFEKMLCHYLCFIKYLFTSNKVKKNLLMNAKKDTILILCI